MLSSMHSRSLAKAAVATHPGRQQVARTATPTCLIGHSRNCWAPRCSQQGQQTTGGGAGRLSGGAPKQHGRRLQQNSKAASRGMQRGSSQPQHPLDAAFEDPLLSSTRGSSAGAQHSWQQRQQRQQRQPRRQQQQRQQQRQLGMVSSQSSIGKASKRKFADCGSYQAVLAALQQEQQQHREATPDQQQQQPLLLNAADTLSLMEQLATISKASSSSNGSTVGSSSTFVEDQALQQLLPLVSLACIMPSRPSWPCCGSLCCTVG